MAAAAGIRVGCVGDGRIEWTLKHAAIGAGVDDLGADVGFKIVAELAAPLGCRDGCVFLVGAIDDSLADGGG